MKSTIMKLEGQSAISLLGNPQTHWLLLTGGSGLDQNLQIAKRWNHRLLFWQLNLQFAWTIRVLLPSQLNVFVILSCLDLSHSFLVFFLQHYKYLNFDSNRNPNPNWRNNHRRDNSIHHNWRNNGYKPLRANWPEWWCFPWKGWDGSNLYSPLALRPGFVESLNEKKRMLLVDIYLWKTWKCGTIDGWMWFIALTKKGWTCDSTVGG